MKILFPLAAIAMAVALAIPAFAQDMMAADANHDGKITRAEFAAARLANFDRLDRNGDGVVSQADLGGIARFRPHAAEALQQLIAVADANHDGQVTRAEMANAPMPVFDRADLNHDGVIDASEMAGFRAALAQIRGR